MGFKNLWNGKLVSGRGTGGGPLSDLRRLIGRDLSIGEVFDWPPFLVVPVRGGDGGGVGVGGVLSFGGWGEGIRPFLGK